MRSLLLRQLLCRIALALSVLFLSGAVVSAMPLEIIEQQEQTEEETLDAKAPLAAIHETSIGKRREAPSVQTEHPSAAMLFASYRRWPPAPPTARGPDALSAPTPHLLN